MAKRGRKAKASVTVVSVASITSASSVASAHHKDYSKTPRFDLGDYNKHIGDYIGVTAWWTIHRVHLSLDVVKNALSKAGIDPNWINPVTEKLALKRAGDEIGHGDEHKFVRKITDAAEKTVIGIVKENVNASEETLDYAQQTTVKLDKASGRLEVEGAEANQIIERFNFFKDNVTDNDIRLMVRHIIDTLNCVPLRQMGGIYFIPKDQVENLLKLDEFLRILNIGKFYILHLQDTEVSREVTWEAMEAEIEKRLALTVETVEKISERAACLEKHEDKLAAIKKVFDHYVKLTESEASAEALREKIEAVGKMITEKLDNLKKTVTA